MVDHLLFAVRALYELRHIGVRIQIRVRVRRLQRLDRPRVSCAGCLDDELELLNPCLNISFRLTTTSYRKSMQQRLTSACSLKCSLMLQFCFCWSELIAYCLRIEAHDA